jgi:hypothetical protein
MNGLTISTGVEWITPQRAAEMLATSQGNRTLKRTKIDAYTREMKAGRWKLNGETIIFDEAGHLIDGHHRLTACIRAEAPFQATVVRGVDAGCRITVDMGASRSVADALGFSGHKNVNTLNSVIVALMSLEKGRPRSATPTAQEVFDFLSAYPEITDIHVEAVRKAVPKLGAIIGAICFVAHRMGEEDAFERFAHVLKTGIPAYDGCPAHALRERIMRSALSKTQQITLDGAQRLAVAAWEKFRISAPARILKVPDEYKITGWPE